MDYTALFMEANGGIWLRMVCQRKSLARVSSYLRRDPQKSAQACKPQTGGTLAPCAQR
jgi:hypothetical protein